VQTDKLWALLRSATAQGVDEPQLATALARVQRLFEGLGRKGQV
jgi:DNA polymerase III delta subunit